MEKNIEKELKLLINKEQFETLLSLYPFEPAIVQTNTYYDTEDQQLKQRNSAMRIRTIDKQNYFTLKIRQSENAHYEYEKAIDVACPQEIKDEQILQWCNQFHIPMDINPIVTFKTQRFNYKTKEAIISADITSYENHIDYEVEYEYIVEHDGIHTLNQFLKPIGVEYKKNCPSKIARAMQN